MGDTNRAEVISQHERGSGPSRVQKIPGNLSITDGNTSVGEAEQGEILRSWGTRNLTRSTLRKTAVVSLLLICLTISFLVIFELTVDSYTERVIVNVDGVTGRIVNVTDAEGAVLANSGVVITETEKPEDWGELRRDLIGLEGDPKVGEKIRCRVMDILGDVYESFAYNTYCKIFGCRHNSRSKCRRVSNGATLDSRIMIPGHTTSWGRDQLLRKYVEPGPYTLTAECAYSSLSITKELSLAYETRSKFREVVLRRTQHSRLSLSVNLVCAMRMCLEAEKPFDRTPVQGDEDGETSCGSTEMGDSVPPINWNPNP
eukprot:scaffold3431_cov78-Cylindrotheca_fusiformis.AAC.1